MTSEEIKNLKRGFGENPIPSEQLSRIRITDGIWEIAYQLADRDLTEFRFWERALLAAVENLAVDNASHAIGFADDLTAAWKARKAHMTAARA